jgi:hypothetical protein
MSVYGHTAIRVIDIALAAYESWHFASSMVHALPVDLSEQILKCYLSRFVLEQIVEYLRIAASNLVGRT